MIGTDRKRFCGECKLNVYNLSGMSEVEAENLLLNSEGRLCVRFFKRADGTILTKDCPVGWQAIKRRVSKTATAFASLFFAALGGIGLSNYFAKASESHTIGETVKIKDIEIPPRPILPTMGEPETIGKVAPNYAIAGGISNIEAVRYAVKEKRRR